jgi:MFS family permease
MKPLIRLIKALLLLESALYSAITPLLPHYAHTLGASKPAIGVLAAAYTAGLIPGAVVGASASTRAGVKRATLAGLVLLAVGTAGFGFAHSLIALDALRAFQGVACGLIWGGALTWVIAITPADRRGALLGGVIGAAILGTLIGPLLGIAAVSLGSGLTFGLVSLVTVAMAARLQRFAEPPRAAPGPRTPLRRILANGGLMIGFWLVVLDALTIGATNVLIPLRLAHLGAGTVAVGAVFLIASATRTAISPALGRVTDRRGVALPMGFGLAASALLMGLMPLPASAAGLAVLSVIALGGPLTTWMIPAGTLMTHAAERGGIALVTSTMLFNLAYALGETFGAPAAASLAQASSDAVPFLLLAGVMVVSLVPVVRPRARSARPEGTTVTAS